MNLIKKAAKHSVPIINERMAAIDAAEEKGTEPELPVSATNLRFRQVSI